MHFVFERTFLEQDLPKSLKSDWRPVSGTNEGTLWLIYKALSESGAAVTCGSRFEGRKVNICTTVHLQNMKPSIGDYFIVCFQMDRVRHDACQVHIVCNKFVEAGGQLSFFDKCFYPGTLCYLPFPPQMGLIPRRPERGDRFESIAYVGNPKNLDVVYRQEIWTDLVNQLGMRFSIRGEPEQFADFSDIDCVLAVRGKDFPGDNKPCSKLWNAWRAGVPIICGAEISFREQRRTEWDFIEVGGPYEVLCWLQRLKTDSRLRDRYIQNAMSRANECSIEKIVALWFAFMEKATRLKSKWDSSPTDRVRFIMARRLRKYLRDIRGRN